MLPWEGTTEISLESIVLPRNVDVGEDWVNQ